MNDSNKLLNKPVKCPCCKQKVKVRDTTLLKLYKIYCQHYQGSTFEDFIIGQTANRYSLCMYLWCCKDCTRNGKAFRARMSKQKVNFYNDKRPLYVDTKIKCKDCGENYIFTAIEQKAWYEKYKIDVDAMPVKCLKCRRKLKATKDNSGRLKELLDKEKEQDLTGAELEELSQIYALMESKKTIEYSNRAKNNNQHLNYFLLKY